MRTLIEETPEMKEQHESNELHRFCRDVDNLVMDGWETRDAYNFMKESYKRKYEWEKME